LATHPLKGGGIFADTTRLTHHAVKAEWSKSQDEGERWHPPAGRHRGEEGARPARAGWGM